MDGELEKEQGAAKGERMNGELEKEQGATKGEQMDSEGCSKGRADER